MKVVFIASQAQSTELESYYKQINTALELHGLSVFSGHLFTKVNDSDLADNKQIESWFKEVVQHVRAADTIFVEISYPSTVNVGHILTYALDTGKPVVALYRSGREPFFLRGRVDDKLILLEYGDKEIKEVDAFVGTPTLQRDDNGAQMQLTPKHFAYVKICESCLRPLSPLMNP